MTHLPSRETSYRSGHARVFRDAGLILSALLLCAWTHPAAANAATVLSIAEDYDLADGGGVDPAPTAMLDFGGRLVLYGPLLESGDLAIDSGAVAWTGSAFDLTGLPSGLGARVLAEHEGSLIFGSSRWDGSQLIPLVGNEPFPIVAVDAAVSTPEGLYAQADIIAGNTNHNRRSLVHWDGSDWTELAAWDVGGRVIAKSGDRIFAATNFSMYPDGVDPANVIAWNLSTQSWESFPGVPATFGLSTATGSLLALSYHGLYAFDESDADFALVPGTEDSRFEAVIPFEGGYAVCGSFAAALTGSTEGANVALWDLSTFAALPRIGGVEPLAIPDVVRRLAVFDGVLYAAGDFDLGSQPEPARGIARLVGNRWVGLESHVGFGIERPVVDLVVHDGSIFAAADRSYRADATYVRESNGWREISSTVRDRVGELASTSAGLVAGGYRFKRGVPGRIATIERYENDEWVVLGEQVSSLPNSQIDSVLEFDGELVVGGFFSDLNGVSLDNVGAYDGSTWHPLGDGLDGSVFDLAMFEGDLVATGDFFTSGATTVSYVARYDGTTWSRMGTGFTSYGICLEVVDGVLYAGGSIQYTAAGYTPHLVRWDGTDWVGVANPPDGIVREMEVVGDQLLVGGDFANAGGQARTGLAAYDHVGQGWADPGFTPDAPVRAMALAANQLHVGGDFTTLTDGNGPQPSVHVGRVLYESSVDVPDLRPTQTARFARVHPNPANPTVNFRVEASGTRDLTIAMHDTRGRLVTELRVPVAGTARSVSWDGRDRSGRPVASGLYLAVLREAGVVRDRAKVSLVK